MTGMRDWRKTLSVWLGRAVGARDSVFPGMPAHIERRLREDAAYAEIEVDAERGERLDFHCLRVTNRILSAVA